MQIQIRLCLSTKKYLHYYTGAAKYVQTKSIDGRNVRFPVKILQAYVTRDGVHGEFVLEYDENNKFVSIRKATHT